MFKMTVLRCTVIIFARRIAEQCTKLMYAKCQFDTSQGVCLDIGIRRLYYLDDMEIFFVSFQISSSVNICDMLA